MQIYNNDKLNKLTIGFLGVGLMGEGMVSTLIETGIKVYDKKIKIQNLLIG